MNPKMAIVTCIMVWEAHSTQFETRLYKDDGLVKKKALTDRF